MKKTNLNGQVLSEKEMKEVKGGFPNVKPLNESFGIKCPVCGANYDEHGFHDEDYSTGLHVMYCLECGCLIDKE